MKRTELGAGRKSLERGSTFKVPRHPMKRKRRPRPSDELRDRMAAFKLSVQFDPCAGCGRWFGYGTWHLQKAHHVVYRQHVPVELAWDPRNAMALCDGCHERHHNASSRIPFSALTEANLEFAREVLGDAADLYLDRRYPGPKGPHNPNVGSRTVGGGV